MKTKSIIKTTSLLLPTAIALFGISTSHGAVSLTADAAYPAGAAVFTVDPTATTTPASRGLNEVRQLRQTFTLSQSINVEEIVFSLDLTGTDAGLVVNFFEVADVNAATWLPTGASLATISLSTAIDMPNSGSTLGLSLTGSDVFSLTATTGTAGYGIEVTTVSGLVGSIEHTNSGTDEYVDGKFYTENNAQSGSGNRDFGIALAGSPVPEPTSALLCFGALGALALRRRRS